MSTGSRLTGAEALKAVEEGAILIDVRSQAGRQKNGEVAGAIVIAKGDVVPLVSQKLAPREGDQKIVLFCGSVAGTETLVAELIKRGVPEVYDVEGGVAALTGPEGLTVSRLG